MDICGGRPSSYAVWPTDDPHTVRFSENFIERREQDWLLLQFDRSISGDEGGKRLKYVLVEHPIYLGPFKDLSAFQVLRSLTVSATNAATSWAFAAAFCS